MSPFVFREVFVPWARERGIIPTRRLIVCEICTADLRRSTERNIIFRGLIKKVSRSFRVEWTLKSRKGIGSRDK